MQNVWVITLVDYGQSEPMTSVEAVCATDVAADAYIKGYISRTPKSDWRQNRRGFKDNWADKNGLSFEVKKMQVWI
jgi:hypothetical protein